MKHFIALISILFSLAIFLYTNVALANTFPIGGIIKDTIQGVTCASSHTSTFSIKNFSGSITTPFFLPNTASTTLGQKISPKSYFLGVYNSSQDQTTCKKGKENYAAYPFKIFGSN